jgi:hypothetical protein
VNVSSSGVWLRHDIETWHKRLIRLERYAREKTVEPPPRADQIARAAQLRLSKPSSRGVTAWRTAQPEHILLIKGLGKGYVQVIVDVSCSFAFAKVYTSKMPITASDLMQDRVLPVYENLGVTVGDVVTDSRREFCGKSESHPYELLLAVESIKHRTAKVRCLAPPASWSA